MSHPSTTRECNGEAIVRSSRPVALVGHGPASLDRHGEVLNPPGNIVEDGAAINLVAAAILVTGAVVAAADEVAVVASITRHGVVACRAGEVVIAGLLVERVVDLGAAAALIASTGDLVPHRRRPIWSILPLPRASKTCGWSRHEPTPLVSWTAFHDTSVHSVNR